MPEINRTFSFDTGIEQIVDLNDLAPAQLPDSGQYVPGEGFYQQQLSEVLFPPSVEQSLVESFRPTIAERHLLTPTGYHAAHTTCKQEVQQAMERFADRPEGAKLEAVLDLLSNDGQLNDLLNVYRHLLHSG